MTCLLYWLGVGVVLLCWIVGVFLAACDFGVRMVYVLEIAYLVVSAKRREDWLEVCLEFFVFLTCPWMDV